MTIGPAVRYPGGPITPHGAYHMLHDRIPTVALRSYDDSIVFNLMGGLAIADRLTPERVELTSMRGLIPPWSIIDQKGASQDGVSFVDALYDPMEVQLGVKVVGRDPAHLRRVVSDLVASLDVKEQSQLSWFTHRLGYWWAPVRWLKTPDDQVGGIATSKQTMTLHLRADDGFWQSYPHTDQFRFEYSANAETFDFITAPGDPITGWTLDYSGAGSGVAYTDGDQAISTLVGGRTVIAQRTAYTASTDNVVIEVELGTHAQPLWGADTYLDVWARMNNTGDLGDDGIRWRIGKTTIRLSSFKDGVEALIREIRYFGGGRPSEKFTFITGVDGDSRTYKMLRNKATMLSAKESGTSYIDSSHRKAGWGMVGGAARPVGLRSWKIGDNNTVAQEGFVERVNVGDQPMWDRFTCFGPGTFWLGNGPGSTELVKFGPLLTNQIMQVRTDPRKRSVVDMTSVPATAQEIALFQKAKKDFLSFLFFSRVTTSPSVESLFGVAAPQGNPYSLLNGRFSRPVPPRSSGNPVQSYHTKVKITGGNSDSQIIVAGTPLRRLPY